MKRQTAAEPRYGATMETRPEEDCCWGTTVSRYSLTTRGPAKLVYFSVSRVCTEVASVLHSQVHMFHNHNQQPITHRFLCV